LQFALLNKKQIQVHLRVGRKAQEDGVSLDARRPINDTS
jgi:hypothetical protein